jgi:hypothetical protein
MVREREREGREREREREREEKDGAVRLLSNSQQLYRRTVKLLRQSEQSKLFYAFMTKGRYSTMGA